MIEGASLFDLLREVQQQDVTSADRSFDSRDQHDAAFARIRGVRRRIVEAIVQRDRESLIPE